MYKKIMAVTVVLLLAVWFLPHYDAEAASDFIIKNDRSGNSFLSEYSGKDSTVVIPQNIKYIGNDSCKLRNHWQQGIFRLCEFKICDL